jgi:glycosyltransferase involved in cell wall biosynthesis
VHGPYPIGEPRVARQTSVAIDSGFDVDIVAMRRDGEQRVEIVEGARVFRLPLAHKRGTGFRRALWEYLSFTVLATFKVGQLSLRRPYAVVHVNNPPDFLVIAALAPKLRRARVILDIHDLSSDIFAMRFGSRLAARLAERILLAIERAAAGLSDSVLTVHEAYRRELIAHGIPAEKVSVVMNTLDERLLPVTRPEAAGDEFRVVYHGTVTPPYGVEVLVEAAALLVRELPKIRVAIYGEGDSVHALRERIAELQLGGEVWISGRYLPQREVLEAVATASVGVIPNLATALNRFALSSKLFEYVALGIPVICSDLPTIREHFSDRELLFFPSGDAARLADCLRSVARDPSAAQARREAATRRYESYRWPTQARRYAELLSRAAT